MYRPWERCKTPHHNEKDNYCNNCRGGIFKFVRHKGESFRYVLDHDISYCEWATQTDQMIQYNPFTHEYNFNYNFFDFKYWLEKVAESEGYSLAIFIQTLFKKVAQSKSH